MKVIRMAGLWKKQDKKGNLILSGDLNEMSRIVIMPNTGKSNPKDPDYFLCIGAKGTRKVSEKALH